MKVPNRWGTAGLVAGALCIGTIIGPPVAQAATAGLVQLEGGGSTHLIFGCPQDARCGPVA
jgi:hypothetical protein